MTTTSSVGRRLGSVIRQISSHDEAPSTRAASYSDGSIDWSPPRTMRVDRLVYLAKLEGRSAYQMRSHVGLTIPTHSTACGKAFLAALPTDEVRSIVGRAGLPGRTERTIVDVNALLAHLELVRRQGFAVDDEENEAHVRCFGALAVDHAGTPVAAVSVSSLTFELDATRQRRHVALITEAASQISQQLGGPPPAVPS